MRVKRVSRIHHRTILTAEDGLVVYPANAFDSRLRVGVPLGSSPTKSPSAHLLCPYAYFIAATQYFFLRIYDTVRIMFLHIGGG